MRKACKKIIQKHFLELTVLPQEAWLAASEEAKLMSRTGISTMTP